MHYNNNINLQVAYDNGKHTHFPPPPLLISLLTHPPPPAPSQSPPGGVVSCHTCCPPDHMSTARGHIGLSPGYRGQKIRGCEKKIRGCWKKIRGKNQIFHRSGKTIRGKMNIRNAMNQNNSPYPESLPPQMENHHWLLYPNPAGGSGVIQGWGRGSGQGREWEGGGRYCRWRWNGRRSGGRGGGQ